MGCTLTPTLIDHLKLTFAAANPPPSHVFEQVTLMAAEESGGEGGLTRGVISVRMRAGQSRGKQYELFQHEVRWEIF
jgi:hypothetical protein